jgi:hypothetical protein
MSITIGSSAPLSTWQIAWQNGAKETAGATISLSSCSGQVVVLLLADVQS